MTSFAGYPLFCGDHGEDAKSFLANLKMVLHISNKNTDEERVGIFEVVLRGNVDLWFKTLPETSKENFLALIEAFRREYGETYNPQQLWTKWVQSLENPGDGAEFLKKERFIAIS